MSKQEPADQVKFLVSCIGHTSNGRPDFQAVANELSIVSKAAAQKRYERMLKAHGIKPGSVSALNGGSNADKSPAKEKATPARATKRKTNGEPTLSPAKKRTRTARAKKPAPKQEDTEEEEEPEPKAEGDEEMKQEEETPASPASSLSDPPASEEDQA